MRSLRDFFGSPCPSCRADILQPAPQVNRMPREEAWCPSCERTMSLADLLRVSAGKTGFFARLFGRNRTSA